MNNLASIIEFVRSNERVCPQPDFWNRLYKLLPNRQQLSSGGWEPSLPLILAAWWETTDEQKQERLISHIHWAEKHGGLGNVEAFIKEMQESDWHHRGD
ncbi:MAG: hypothetical protein HQL44_15260 [Alphaproteobacteria bacterium]|nr:hypothetical protein [Alphaproteobacteria bacterium]